VVIAVPTPKFFLAEALRDRFHAERRSWARLASEITNAHTRATQKQPSSREFVDRRKLQAISEGRRFVLSLEELEALDSYLEPLGLGISTHPILRKPSVIETLADRGRIVFLIGSRSHSHGWNLSLWDVNAMAEIQHAVSRRRPGVTFEIRAVHLKRRTAEARAAAKKLDPLFVDDGPSIVCLGSPRANLASEVMFSRLFDAKPFLSSWGREPALPFHFVRPRDQNIYRSCIEIDATDVHELSHADAPALERGDKWALRVGDKLHLADPKGTEPQMTTRGVLMAQRQSRGQVWMVLAGLSGPGTLGAAEAVCDVDARLSPRRAGKPSLVVWAPVVADARSGGEESPELDRRELMEGPHRWSLEEC
jgi:hypothetical protein